jgi:hypothetical protein
MGIIAIIHDVLRRPPWPNLAVCPATHAGASGFEGLSDSVYDLLKIVEMILIQPLHRVLIEWSLREHLKHVLRAHGGSNAVEALIDAETVHVVQCIQWKGEPVCIRFAVNAVIKSIVESRIEVTEVGRWNECPVGELSHRSSFNVGQWVGIPCREWRHAVAVWLIRVHEALMAVVAIIVDLRGQSPPWGVLSTGLAGSIRTLLDTDHSLFDLHQYALDHSRCRATKMDIVNDLGRQ